MALEISAARLLAPYVGVSLYTWTAIIGVVLAGLSLGNWLGGVWADRGAGEREAGLTLGLSGLFCLGALLSLTWLGVVVQRYVDNLITAGFLYMAGLFFLPAICLGIITPLLTTLALRLDPRAGHVVGRMHALAALGSIAGTFFTGYWLIQYFGTRLVISGIGLMLLLLALPFLRRQRNILIGLLSALILIAGLTWLQQGFSQPCDRESNYFCIRVVEENPLELGPARTLVLDHLVHGTNHKTQPGLLLAPYVHLMDELIRAEFSETRRQGLNYFFAGGGAYTQPRAVQAATPGAQITVAELDPAVTRMARERLFFEPGPHTRVLHADARLALGRQPPQHFDVIVGDVFHDVAIPYHLLTREFMALIKSRLKEDGLYLMNVVDVFPDPRLVKSLVKTCAAQFGQVRVWMDHLPDQPTRMTYVISAGDHHSPPDRLTASHGLSRTWYEISEPLAATGTPIKALPVLRDDYVPVDRLISSLLLTELGESGRVR